MSMDNILSLVEQYAEARQLAETAQAEMETLKLQITAEMENRGVQKMEIGSHKIALSSFTSTRLDSKAIKAVAPDLYAEYSKTVSGVRFTVS